MEPQEGAVSTSHYVAPAPSSFRSWDLRDWLEGLQLGDSKLVHHPVTAFLAALCPSPGLTLLTGAGK